MQISTVVFTLGLVAAVLLATGTEAAGQTRFKGKKVLVTGGSSGIGFQTALEFAREGATVVFCSRDSHPTWFNGTAAETRINSDETVKATGGRARWVKADVSSAPDVKALFESIRAEEGLLDIAVNCAGISGPIGVISETGKYAQGEHDPIAVNLYGVLRCMAEEESMMLEGNISGAIVNVASLDGLLGAPTGSMYSASKFGVVGATKSMALAHITGGPYIRANAVAPGPVATPLFFNQVKMDEYGQQPWEGELVTEDSALWQKYKGDTEDVVPMHALARPKQIADPILWLCSDEAAKVSGDTLIVDGGIWAK